MATVNDVYRKIKDLSAREWTPRPSIAVATLSSELSLTRESVMPMLTELQDMKLIRFNETTKASLRLTLLGHTVNRDKQ